MARRSAGEGGGEPKLLMVAPGRQQGPRRKRHVPVADLLAREGRPLSVDDDFLVADAIVSVRKGMAGLCVGVLAVIGGATVANDLMTDPPDSIPQSGGRPESPVTSAPTQTTVQDVVRAAKRTKEKSEPRRKYPARTAPRTESRQPAPAANNSAPDPAPRPALKQQSNPEPDWQEMSGDYGKDYSGNYGSDYSGNYGQGYWGG